MPVTGMMPMVMPMFSKQLKAKKTKTPMQMMRPIVSLARRPMRKSRNATKASNRRIEHRSDEPQLFADGREDEVRVLFGHVAEVRLKALEETRAVQSARADGVLGVVDVVDVLRPLRARRVLVEEAREAVDRVAPDEVEVERGDDAGRTEHREQRQQPRRDARHDQHRPDTQYHDDRRAQVGLHHDER